MSSLYTEHTIHNEIDGAEFDNLIKSCDYDFVGNVVSLWLDRLYRPL